MFAVLKQIAAVANGLSKAELHILIELASRAELSPELQATASSRELAERTGLARASVQAAIDSLNRRQLLYSDSGSATRPAVHRLLCLDAADIQLDGPTSMSEVAQQLGQGGLNSEPGVAQKLSHGGLTAGPEVAQILGQGGLDSEPGVAQKLSHGGLTAGPGAAQILSQGGPKLGPVVDEKSVTSRSAHIERADARADSIDFDFDNTIDRLQKAQKSDFDESLFELARNRIASHHAKFSREENQLPSLPDDTITAQFLAVAEWPKLETMLLDLAGERREAGHSYGWYVTVALQRIHGVSPARLRDVRARLKPEVSRPALIPKRTDINRKPARPAGVEECSHRAEPVAESPEERTGGPGYACAAAAAHNTHGNFCSTGNRKSMRRDA
jgi:hypothetical protein